MGIEDNKFQIDDIADTTTFFDWASKTNTEIIGKLNRLFVYDGISGDGINVVVGTTGATLESGSSISITAGDMFVELSGEVDKGMTFNGDVTINGLLTYDFAKSFAGVPLISVSVTGPTLDLNVGDVVRFGENLPVTPNIEGSSTYDGVTLAKADSATSAEVFGIVSGVTGDASVEVTISGEVTINSDRGLTVGCVHFLSPDVAGRLTKDEPTILGQVSKPVLIATGASSGVLYNFRGQQLTATGGTGAFQGDNNAFFITGFSSDPNGRTIEKGKMVIYNANEGRFEIANGNSSNSIEQLVGIITEDSSTLGSGVVKVVCGGVVLNATELVGSLVGPLYVDSTGSLQSTFGGTVPGTGDPVAMSMLLGSDTALIVNFTTGNGGQVSGGGGIQFFESNLPDTPPAGGFFVPSANQARQFSRTANPIVLGATAATGGTVYVNNNELINGAMTVWQRGVGVGSAYTGTGGTYFADRWVRVDGSTAPTKTYSLERKDFTETQSEVEGNPLYYLRASHSATGGITLGAGSMGGIQIENRIEGADSFRGENMTFSFYARTSGTSGSTCSVFLKQNYGTTGATSDETVTQLGTIRFGSDFAKYITVFGVPAMTQASNTGDSFFSVGLDQLPYGVSIDVAQAKLERGNAATPVEPRNIDEEYELCARYYQRSYAPDISTRTATFASGIPDPTSVNFTAIKPDADYYYRFHTRMRDTPSTTMYSPLDGATGTAYNRTAGKNMEKTSGSVGLNAAIRSAPAGKTTIDIPLATKDGLYFTALSGFVDNDNISVHYIADADINIDID